MALSMTREEREKFLADVHVGVLAIPTTDGAPLTVPIWYGYEPGGEIRMITAGDSLKAQALRSAERASLVAQTEEPPLYKYVSVEGPVTIEESVDQEERKAIAYRYFGQELGDAYLEMSQDEGAITVSLRPERWRTVDYAKGYGS